MTDRQPDKPMRRINLILIALTVLSATAGSCRSSKKPQPPPARNLEPYPNRFPERKPELYTELPNREKPRALALAANRNRLYVALQGSIDNPGNEVVAVDTERRKVVKRFRVGRSPTGLALHPERRFLVVTTRYTNRLSIIDLKTGKVGSHPADVYLVQPTFSPSGDRLYATNRWRDSLQIWDVDVRNGKLQLERVAPSGAPHGIPVGTNPRDLTVSADGSTVYVASQGDLSISAIDTQTLERRSLPAPVEKQRFVMTPAEHGRNVAAPPNDLVIWKEHLYVPTLSANTHHPPHEGPDTDGDGRPGDSTPNMDFNDLQNEIAVYSLPNLQPKIRYTSDTICCREYRDVSPSDPKLGELLPPKSTWIVEGALPEQAILAKLGGQPHLVVAYSGSNELQRFRIGEDGALSPGPVVSTGYNPMGLAVDEEKGEVYVSNRLGETISVVDLESFDVVTDIVVGDVSGGDFPATDAEIGEFLMFSGAEFSIDGDQTCHHCHRGRGTISKSFHMPLLEDPRGTRKTPDHRGLFGTRPWFIEGAMDENNFFPVINEFARAENFCCWDFPDRKNCPDNPPKACADRTPPRNIPTRDAFFLQRAEEVLGRTRSFGDALKTNINYLGMTRLLGIFLLQEPALLPNPNPDDTPSVRRGQRLFNSPKTGCAGCHPPPNFAVSFQHNPFDAPLRFGPVITPNRAKDGANLDLAARGFLGTFPMAEQAKDIRLKSSSLIGIWDRPAPFLHDGRAESLREVICTPGHPALRPGETGFNELNGIPDTHGGTSHLTKRQVSDLVAFLRSL